MLLVCHSKAQGVDVGRVFLLTEPKLQQSSAVTALFGHKGRADGVAFTRNQFTLVTGQSAEADIQLAA